MPNISPVTSRSANALGVILPLLGLSNPVSAAIAGAVGLIGLVDKIGQGRKAANRMTGAGGPQDIINKQLRAISGSQASPQEKAQATEKAWTDFLQASNEFAAANPKQAKVVQQAIYQTPELTNTVKTLMGGKDPLDPVFTQQAAQGIATGQQGRNPGPSVLGTVVNSGLSAAAPFLMGAARGAGGGSAAGDVVGEAGGVIPGSSASGGGSSGGVAGILGKIFGGDSNSILPTLFSGGTTLLSSILGSRAAQNAAETQANAADEALGFAKDVYGDQQAANKPFLEAGTNALGEIQKLIGDGGELSKGFTAPTGDEVRGMPGYQFALEEGQKAIDRASRGVRNRNVTTAAAKFGNDYADAKYMDWTKQAMDIFNMNRANKLNPLFTVAGFGPNAVAQNTAQGSQAVNNVGDFGLAGATATAKGDVASTNALMEALKHFGDLATQRQAQTRSSV